MIILCLPPHCTHRLQPLDVSFMAPLMAYYEQAVRQWLINNPGRYVTIYQVAELFDEAFSKAALSQTAKNRFIKTGIRPCKRYIFPDYLFAPSETTERPVPQSETIERPVPQSETTERLMPQLAAAASPTTSQPTSEFTVSPCQLRPPPHEAERIQRKSDRRRGKTSILTSPPYKNNLEAESTSRTKETPKRSVSKIFKTKRLQKKRQRRDSSSSDEEDTACIFCNELYSTSTEDWIQCTPCQGWAHVACTTMDGEDQYI